MGEYNTLLITKESEIFNQTLTVDEALQQVNDEVQVLADKWAAQ